MITSIAGPFGSYGVLGITERVLFWTPVIAVALIAATFVRAIMIASFGLKGGMKGSALAAGLNALAISPPLYLVLHVMLPTSLADMLSGMEIALLVTSISLGVCALRVSVAEEPLALAAAPEVPSETEQPRLMRRIDPEMQGEIWAMTVRDHYVDVQTSKGKVSLLMRLSDAIHEVENVPGAQVHRSHWVAWAGVALVCREGGRMNLQLKNGSQIPVSRNHRDKVEAQFPVLAEVKTAAA